MLSKGDKRLLNDLLHRREKALFYFYRQNKQPLFKFISARIGDREDIQEVLQDSFFAFIESLRDFRGQASLKTFLYSIAKNKIVDKLRKKKLKRILFSHFPQSVINSLGVFFKDDDIDRNHLAGKINDVFSLLPHDYATVLRLKYQDGYNVVEIAEQIKLSFKATESLIFRARRAFVKIYLNHDG